MLDKIMNQMEQKYAINVLRRLETMNFSSKDLAEEYFKITYDMLRADLHGLSIEPSYREKMTINAKGKNIGKRYNVWTVRVVVMEKHFNVLN